MDKHEIAHILHEISILLEVEGENPFKIRAFQNAARVIEATDENLTHLAVEKRLTTLPGIGESIAEKITTLIETGHLAYYEELKRQVPEGVLDFLKVQGLGGKKIHVLFHELGLKTIDELVEACKKGLVAKLPGFGKKTQANILSSLSSLKRYSQRHLWWEASAIAEPILQALQHNENVQKVELCGSMRRKLETVGDLDFLVASDKPDAVMEWYTKQPWTASIIAKGHSKSSIRLKNGMQADLRVVPLAQFAFALVYFTGSKEHNVALRQRAIKQGLHLSEYGFEPQKRLLKSEAEIYKAFKLSYIEPELREDRGEIEAAERNRLPKLIETSDLKGAFHCHTTESDGHNTLDEMVLAAEERGWLYIGIADHSKSSYQAHGMKEDRLFSQIAEIERLNKSKKYKTHIFSGLECDILNNGSLDFPNEVLAELDYVVVSIHRSFKMPEIEMTKRLITAIENPYSTMVGLLTGRLLLKREGYALNIDKVIDACIANGTIIELNASPMRLDMDWRHWHKASEKGLLCSINPDAHSTGDLDYIKAGINIARKGWLEKRHVINTMLLSEVKKFLKQT